MEIYNDELILFQINVDRKTLTEPPVLPDGRKCARTIRFERPEGENSKTLYIYIIKISFILYINNDYHFFL